MAEWQSDLLFRTCLERVEWEVSRLRSREHEWEHTPPRKRARLDKQSRAERAFSFVYLAGALEDLFRKLNVGLAADLQRLEVRPRDLRPTALSVLFPKAWDAINTDRVVRLVKRRDLVEVIGSFYSSGEPIDLASIDQLGVHDGRTVNVHHFEAIWEGLCLGAPGKSIWASPKHRQAIISVADKRNAIAHFETDPREEAFRFTYGDLGELAERVRATVEHLHEGTIIWLDRHAVVGVD